MVDAWFSSTAPRTITEYSAESSDELLVDLAEDLYYQWKWRNNTKGGNTITQPGGSKGYQELPKYPSERTKEKHDLSKSDNVPSRQFITI